VLRSRHVEVRPSTFFAACRLSVSTILRWALAPLLAHLSDSELTTVVLFACFSCQNLLRGGLVASVMVRGCEWGGSFLGRSSVFLRVWRVARLSLCLSPDFPGVRPHRLDIVGADAFLAHFARRLRAFICDYLNRSVHCRVVFQNFHAQLFTPDNLRATSAATPVARTVRFFCLLFGWLGATVLLSRFIKAPGFGWPFSFWRQIVPVFPILLPRVVPV